VQFTHTVAPKTEVSLRDQATAFMGVSKDTKRSEEDIISTPLPGETLAVFYARSREFYFFHSSDGELEVMVTNEDVFYFPR
jgi:hypothetical protein